MKASKNASESYCLSLGSTISFVEMFMDLIDFPLRSVALYYFVHTFNLIKGEQCLPSPIKPAVLCLMMLPIVVHGTFELIIVEYNFLFFALIMIIYVQYDFSAYLVSSGVSAFIQEANAICDLDDLLDPKDIAKRVLANYVSFKQAVKPLLMQTFGFMSIYAIIHMKNLLEGNF